MAPSHHPNSCLFDEDPGIMSEADTSSTRWAKNGHFPDEKVRWIEEYHIRQGSIYWKIPHTLGGGGKYQPMSFGGKNMKSGREKRKNVKEKGRKGKEKGRRGKE